MARKRKPRYTLVFGKIVCLTIDELEAVRLLVDLKEFEQVETVKRRFLVRQEFPVIK